MSESAQSPPASRYRSATTLTWWLTVLLVLYVVVHAGSALVDAVGTSRFPGWNDPLAVRESWPC